MNLRRTIYAIVAALLPAGLVQAAPPGWTMIWNDEFDGAQLDLAKWAPETTTTPYNNERQAYLPEQITVADGNMVITSENVPYGGKQYRSGRVHSVWTHQYGRWEVRADLPTSRGMWPAIWLLPDTTQYPWPSQGEIDIMENRGTQPHLTSSAFHYGSSTPFSHRYTFAEQTTARFGQPVNFHDGFHVYALEWDATKLRFFVDDVHYLTVFDADVAGFLGRQTAPMQMTLNTAVGGDFLGALQPNASTVWPQQFLIDYVRTFDRDDSPRRFRNGAFDQRQGSLAGWSIFGNRIDVNNVSIHNEAVHSGGASLKLFGQSTGMQNYSGVSQGISVAAGDEVRASAESFIRAQDSIAGTGASLQMKIEFYSDFGGKHGTPALVDEVIATIADGASPNDQWRSHALSAIAPPGAVEARLSLVFVQPAAGGAGAVHIDNASFRNLSVADVADADGDGDVDGADFLRWQQNLGKNDPSGPADGDFNFDGAVDDADRAAWTSQSGAAAQGEQGATQSLPEPSAAALALAASLMLLVRRTV
jgi:beta-glucanase (GH16 family)